MPSDFRGFGLHLRSDIPLPGAQPSDPSPLQPDLHIVNGPATLVADGSPVLEAGPYRLTADALLFTATGVARYLIQPSASLITVEPLPGASPDDIHGLLTATALPAALWMRGDILLHAATAILPGSSSATAFLGPSGIGKSTLLRQLLALGATAVSDDVLCLRLTDNHVLGSGLPACTLLRAEAETTTRIEIRVPLDQQSITAELSGLVLLTSAPARPSARLRGPLALQTVLQNLHRPAVPRLLGQHAALLPRLAAISQSVPVYPWNVAASASPGLSALFEFLANGGDPIEPDLGT